MLIAGYRIQERKDREYFLKSGENRTNHFCSSQGSNSIRSQKKRPKC